METATAIEQSTFLKAEWRNLIMLNYEIEPSILTQWLPKGTELDYFKGRTYVSIVAFQFLHARVLGVGIPLHRDFEEINLRFYVKRNDADGLRRGVVFVNEVVPRRAIAWVARGLYSERYQTMPMMHSVSGAGDELAVEYRWRPAEHWGHVRAKAAGAFAPLQRGSFDEFIAEHFWGYAQRDGSTVEYSVEHPSWRIAPVEHYELDIDIEALYGAEFVETLREKPASVFIAEGSEVKVHRGRVIE
jgi:uncharacterized protein